MEQTSRLVERIERDLGLSTDDLADLHGVAPRAVERWRAGETAPQCEARDRLAELEALHAHLHETFMPEAIPVWLRLNNRYLKGLTPAEALRHGRFERVEAALEAIDSGFFV